ncbi:MAG: acyl carrier protein [Bacteroidales bacterium]|nr:acyl carrier protein [Bacteroidales bacterium]
METRFINLFAEVLELEDDHNLTTITIFRELDEWDSLAYLSVIAMIDEEFDIVIEGNDFKKLITIGDLINEIQRKSQ